MKTRELAPKPPVTISPQATLSEAAQLMDASNVGALVVLDGERLVGIVTDRDLVVSGVARRVPFDARIDSVMTTDVITVDAEADIRHVYEALGRHGVRRLPVVDGARVVGLVCVDDLLLAVAADLQRLVHPIVGELAFGHHPAPTPVLR